MGNIYTKIHEYKIIWPTISQNRKTGKIHNWRSYRIIITKNIWKPRHLEIPLKNPRGGQQLLQIKIGLKAQQSIQYKAYAIYY